MTKIISKSQHVELEIWSNLPIEAILAPLSTLLRPSPISIDEPALQPTNTNNAVPAGKEQYL